MIDRFESLRTIPLFHTLGENELRGIAARLIDRKFPKGATIMEDGVGGDYMYVIQQGQVKVTKMSDEGREKILEILGEGDFFGEMALLDREPRSASVKTTRACVLLALSRGDIRARRGADAPGAEPTRDRSRARPSRLENHPGPDASAARGSRRDEP